MFEKQRNKGLIMNLKFYRGKLATVTRENKWNFFVEYFKRAAFFVELIHKTKIRVTRGFPMTSDIEYFDHISVIFFRCAHRDMRMLKDCSDV